MSDFLQRAIAVDCETTGLDCGYDCIIEFGFALFESTRWTHKADFFVNPDGRSISPFIENLTGLTFEQLDDAPRWPEVYNRVAPPFYGATPIAYNAPFDRRFVQSAVASSWPRHAFGEHLPPWLMLDVRWVDPCCLARGLVDGVYGNKYKLENVADRLGFDTTHVHRADVDALLAGSILLKLINDNPHLDWSYAATIARQRQFEARYQRNKFFWTKPDFENDPNAAWLGENPVQVFECDVCHAMQAGRYGKNGWTLPEGWGYYAASGVRLVCGSACEGIMSWHEGRRVTMVR